MPKSFSKYKDTPVYVTRLARENRINPTACEEKLWVVISGKKLSGLKFRRQFPIGRYIADFYNHDNRLVIEIDGKTHDSTKEYDANRDAYMQANGYKVQRFTNTEIEYELDMVINKMLAVCQVPLRGI